jgi:HAD superfamily hydrolase (TIGR01509 family)
MIKNIIFDNDGVLVDTEKLFFQACKETLQRVGVELTLELYQDVSLRQGKSSMHVAKNSGKTEDEIQQLRLDRDVVYRELLTSSVTVIAGVMDVLQALHGRVKMGVVTSSPRQHFELIHQQTGITDYLDFVYAQEDFTRLKPFPDPYLLALNEQNLVADETIVIEDTERGLASAMAAGIRCLVLPSEVSNGGDFTGAYRVLDRIDEVLELFDF